MASRWTSDNVASAAPIATRSRFPATSGQMSGSVSAAGGMSSRSGSSVVHGPAAFGIAACVPPAAEEGVLDDVLGERGVAGDPEGDGVGHDTVAVVELLEGVELSGVDEGEDPPVGVVG